MKSDKAVAVRSARELRGREEFAFLPAALEIVETPPSPIGRAISLIVAALFLLAIAWATFGEVDIVATAPGKIVPSGRTKVRAAVRDRRRPRDPRAGRPEGQGGRRADRARSHDRAMPTSTICKADLMAQRLDVARLNAALAPGDDPASLPSTRRPARRRKWS